MTETPVQQDGEPTRATVVGKFVGILECFDAGQATLSLAEIARRTGFPKSTVHRHVHAMVEWGALERTYGEYRIGLRLFEIGSGAQRYMTIREAAQPFMQELLLKTRQTVHLGILDGGDVLYLDKIRSRQAPATISRAGGRLPATCTALGKSLLAAAAPSDREAALEVDLQRLTRRSIARRSTLLQDLERTAERGYAIDREEAILGLNCVAAAVLNPRGRPIAALSISVPTSDTDPEGMNQAVRAAAGGLANALLRMSYVL